MRTDLRFWSSNKDIRRYGGIVTPSDFSGKTRRILQYCRQIVETVRAELEQRYGWRLNKLDFFFLNSRDVNAVMIRQGNRHGIGFCVGLPLTLWQRLSIAMASPDFLPEYLSREERPEWTQLFLGQIVEHVYLHEAAHALRGHLAFLNSASALKSRRKSLCLEERGRRQDHYVELDADVHALDMWMETVTVRPDYPQEPHLREDLYFQKLLTLQLLYQTLDTDGTPIHRSQHHGHPPPIHRTLALANAMLHSGPDGLGIDREQIENVHWQAIWEASMAAKANGLVQGRWWGTPTQRQGRAAYNRFLRHYTEYVEPALDAFGDDLPDDLV